MSSPPTTTPPSGRPHVLIIGCGFGGLEAARKLQRADVDITIVDKTNHHLFQPLLYQVATAGLAAPSIAAPIRLLFRRQPNITTLLGEAVRIDPAARTVHLADGSRLSWDHLIVAAGSTHSYFGNDAWEPMAPGLKTLADAFEIRRRVLVSFEAAIDPSSAEVLLIEGGARVLQAMPESLSQRALEQLQKLGVQVRLNARVTAIDATGLQISSPFSDGGAGLGSHRIDCGCVIWAAGVAASPLGRMLASATGAETDRAGRVKVLPDLSLPGRPDISVVGDLAAATSHLPGKEPTPVPGVSPGAKQMGRAAAANILRRIAGQPTEPFRYRDYGNLATIGRNSAVVDLGTPVGPLRFAGKAAWLFWLFAHIYFLIGFRNRFVVLMDWASAYWSFQRHARVVADVRAKEKIQ